MEIIGNDDLNINDKNNNNTNNNNTNNNIDIDDDNIDDNIDDNTDDDNIDDDNIDDDTIDDDTIDDDTIDDDNIQDELRFLINNNYIPTYLYPIKYILKKDIIYKIDDDYIKMISEYLYNLYIYDKIINKTKNKKFHRFINKKSKLNQCTYASEISKIN